MSESRKKNKIDVSKIDLEKEREKITDLPGLISYAHTVGSALIRPEDQGKIKGRAVTAMYDQTERQFKQIYDQMHLLLEQARDLKDRVEVSERIYKARLSFDPVINEVYYLYEKKDSTDTLSMVGPDEWGRSFPFEKLVARVKLLSDHTWEIL